MKKLWTDRAWVDYLFWQEQVEPPTTNVAGFLVRRATAPRIRSLTYSPQAFGLVRAVPALPFYMLYAVFLKLSSLSPSFNIFRAAFSSLSCIAPHFGHVHFLTLRFFVSVFL